MKEEHQLTVLYKSTNWKIENEEICLRQSL